MVVVARLDAVRREDTARVEGKAGRTGAGSPAGSKPARAGASIRDDEEAHARRKRMGQRPKQKLMLWWCWTEDHHEDWFVVAGHGVAAVGFFESEEGYGEGDVQAKGLRILPEEYQDEKYLGWPSPELLVACGAKVIHEETPRVVELQGERYVEGMLEHQILQVTDDEFERQGRGRPNRTRPGRTS